MSRPTDRNAEAILRSVAQRHVDKGEIRPHELNKTVAIAHTLWTGDKGNGQAVEEAVRVIRSGAAS